MTQVGLVGALESWPGAASKIEFEVLGGELGEAALFDPEGPWEIALVWRGAVDRKTLVIPVGFPTKEAGDKAAAILSDAFARVNELADGERPDPETCEHEIEIMRFKRSLPPVRKCRLCLKEFGDVSREEWLAARA